MKRNKAFKAALRLMVAGVFALQVMLGSLMLPGGLDMQAVYGAGAANVALNKPATASCSTAPYSAARAVDGQITPTSRWQCSNPVRYLTVDLKGVYQMNRWVVKNMGAAGWTKDNNTQAYRLQRSMDGTRFFDVDAVTKNTANITDRSVAAFTARYVRLYVDSGSKSNPKMANILELEVYGTAVKLPIVTTGTASAMSYDRAALSGNVSSDGGAAISERGFVYSTAVNPTTASSKIISKGTTGSFSAVLTGLLPGTVYHIRAYATNPAGTAYGKDISITTPARDRAPIAGEGSVSCPWGGSYNFSYSDFTKYYYDFEGSSLGAIKITTLPKGGSLLLNGLPIKADQLIAASDIANMSFIPAQNFCGPTTFKWKAWDGKNYSAADGVYTINVMVTGVVPKIINITKAGFEDTALKLSLNDFSSAFFGPGGSKPAMITFVTVPDKGTLKLGDSAVERGISMPAAMADGLSFVPAYNWSGSTSFIWTASDGSHWADTSATFAIDIAPVNDKPISENGFKQGEEDTPLTFMGSDFISRYTDFEGSALAGIKLTALPANGSLLLGGSKININTEIPVAMLSELVFVPDKDFYGTTYFYFRVSDGSDFSDWDSKFVLSIAGVNDAPVLTEGTKTGLENTSLTFSAADFTKCYYDGENSLMSCIKIISLPAHGTLMLNDKPINMNSFINADELEHLVFIPERGWSGTTSFTWRAYDSTDVTSADASFTINIASDGITP